MTSMVNVRLDGIFIPSTGDAGFGRGVTLRGIRGKRVVFKTDRQALLEMANLGLRTGLTPLVKLEREDLAPDDTEGWVMDAWFPQSLLDDREATWVAVVDVGDGEHVTWKRLVCDPALSRSHGGWFIPGPDYNLTAVPGRTGKHVGAATTAVMGRSAPGRRDWLPR